MATFDPFTAGPFARVTLNPGEVLAVDTRGVKGLEIQLDASTGNLHYVPGDQEDAPPNPDLTQYMVAGEYRAFVAESVRCFTQGYTFLTDGTNATAFRLAIWR